MARTVAELPKGVRITDYISLGVLTKTFPLDRVNAVVAAAGKTSRRQRDLPAHVVLYYVIALTLYMQVSYREVLRCFGRHQVVAGAGVGSEGDGQVGHLAGTHPTGMGTAEATP